MFYTRQCCNEIPAKLPGCAGLCGVWAKHDTITPPRCKLRLPPKPRVVPPKGRPCFCLGKYAVCVFGHGQTRRVCRAQLES
eukprot:350559-Chlamydomonas_euryale.AAC.5